MNADFFAAVLRSRSQEALYMERPHYQNITRPE
jgi:hypothetical protein